jgi:hypothetical protein
MKKIYIGLLLLSTLTGLSCNNGQQKCGPCPLAAANLAILMVAKVKIVDKTTGADLFLSHSSPYKLSDLSVTSSTDGPVTNFMVDTVDANNHSVWLLALASQTYTIQLASLSADHIKIITGPNSQKCCATNEVKSIMLNDSLVCAPCSPQQDVVIRK